VSAWWIIAAWLALNALFGGWMAFRAHCKQRRELKKWKRRAERTHRFWETMRRLSHTN